MIKKSILAAACCLPLGLLAQKGFTVRGKIGTLDAPAKAYLKYSNDGNKVLDSAILRKGRFTFTGKLSSPVAADLIIKHDTAATPKFARQDSLHLYIENADITVTASDSIWRAVVKGSATNDDDRTLKALQQPYRGTVDSVTKVFYSWTPEEQKDTTLTKQKQLGRVLLSAQAGWRNVSRAFIANHPNSYISLRVFNDVEFAYAFDPSLNPDTTAAKFARFPASLKESPLGKQMVAMIEASEKTKMGKVAMDFTQIDTTGKAVKLSDFRGQYVLVDFWASWCSPCRAENPNLLKAYNKYKSKNFTILGISLDDEKGRQAWLGAVKYDGLPWTQVSELTGRNKAAALYGVKAIPANFLIDPDGKIIAKNLRGEELDKKLAALLLPLTGMAQGRYTISGELPGLTVPATAYLSTLQDDTYEDKDSVAIKDGKFQFMGSVNEPRLAIIVVRRNGATASETQKDEMDFFLENSKISIAGADSIKNATITGSKSDREHKELFTSIKPFTNAFDNLNKEFYGKPKDEAYKRAADSVSKLVAKIKDIQLKFAESHLNSYMGLYVYHYFVLDSHFDPVKAEPFFHQFPSELQSSELGKRTLEKIEIAKRRQIGINAADFTQNDLNDKPFTLSSLRGKYVLVDFWASWCSPCRAENPNLVKAYAQLKGKNFEVVGVSLDQSKGPWEYAVKKDSLPWIHVCDLKGWKNEVALMYGITSVPQNLLIDPQGVIIATNLRGEDLTGKLAAFIK